MAKPFVKWVGGKGQLLPQLAPLFPKQFRRYHEPFLGGGAVFFYLQAAGRIARTAFLSDINRDLINAYQMLKCQPQEVINHLREHKNHADYFYETRALDTRKLTPIEQASRFIYLNKTCYNGLYRVNRAGQFNVPFGRYKNPCICDEENLMAVHYALQDAQLMGDGFENTPFGCSRGDFVYLDPPYHPISATSNFTSYTGDGFGMQKQRLLAGVFYALDKRGCYVMLSNSDTPFIRELYAGYRIETVQATRRVNSKADGRGAIAEVVVLNY